MIECGEAKRILVIENEQSSREGLRRWLLAEGYRVGTARDGWEAIRSITSQAWDLAIVDLDLPPVMDIQLTGWDLVRILRAYDPRVPILVVSAEDGPGLRDQLQDRGVDRFLGKPLRLAQLREAIRILGVSKTPRGGGEGVGTPCLSQAAGRTRQPGDTGHTDLGRRTMRNIAILFVLVAVLTAGCAGFTAQEKGAIIGGAGGAASGALIGAAAGNAAVGAAIGGPFGLIGGYLLGDRFFRNDPGVSSK